MKVRKVLKMSLLLLSFFVVLGTVTVSAESDSLAIPLYYTQNPHRVGEMMELALTATPWTDTVLDLQLEFTKDPRLAQGVYTAAFNLQPVDCEETTEKILCNFGTLTPEDYADFSYTGTALSQVELELPVRLSWKKEGDPDDLLRMWGHAFKFIFEGGILFVPIVQR